jgi:AcrR family transcriptional regulator
MSMDRQRIGRETILEGAFRILESGRYGDLTVDALARSLRMSKSTLYKYFPSKENVVEALVEQACATTEAELQVAADTQNGDAGKAIEGVVSVLARHLARLPRAVLVAPEALPNLSRNRLTLIQGRMVDAAREATARGKTGASQVVPVALVAGASALAASSARGEVQGDRVNLVVALGRMMTAAVA